MKALKLQDGIRSTVYTIVVGALKAHPTLKATIHPNGWRTYTDEPDNDTPPGEDTLPWIEVMPFGLSAGPASLVMQESPMGIGINIACDSLDVRDLLNLWEAVEGALFKGDGQATLLHTLKSRLAEIGPANIAAISLTNPAITPTESQINKQVLVAAGTINVQLRIPR